MTALQDVWVCGQDLQLVRADRIVSLLVPLATGYGAASPDDPVSGGAVFAEVNSSASGGSALARVKLAACGSSPAGELLAGLAHALGSASSSDGPTRFVFADQDPTGRAQWIVTDRLPRAWPQSTPSARTASSSPELPRPGRA